MQPRNKAAVWANDDAVPDAAKAGGAVTGKRRRVADKEGEGSDGEGQGDSDEEFQDLSEVKPKGIKKRKAAVVLEGGLRRSALFLLCVGMMAVPPCINHD